LSQPASDPDNKANLVWSLEGVSDRERSMQFLMMFQDTFPVYHRYMEQIYLRYSFTRPPGADQIIIEPSFQLHERVNRVTEDALEDQHIYILPGEVVDQPGLFMRYPRMRGGDLSETVTSGLAASIKVLYLEFQLRKQHLIPVFSKQTIRDYQQAGVPNMELDLYNLEKDTHLSPFNRGDIFHAIYKRLLELKFD
jgi:hypothetical protein